MSLRASAHTGVALSKDSLRSQSVFLLVCTEIGIVIANQSADWCGNPPDVPRTTGEAQRLPLLTKGGAPRSELKSNNCRWQLLHNVKVARRSRDG